MLVAATPFGERLKALRTARGLTLAQLAELSGVTFQAISRLERGEREPAWGTVTALARALGVSVAAFDPESDQPTPPAAVEPPKPPGRKRGGK